MPAIKATASAVSEAGGGRESFRRQGQMWYNAAARMASELNYARRDAGAPGGCGVEVNGR